MNHEHGRTDKAAYKLAILDEKISCTRAQLVSLQQEITESKSILINRLQIEHLVKANQQLVLAILALKSKNENKTKENNSDLYATLCKVNEELIRSTREAQNLQAKAESECTHQKEALTIVSHELLNPLTPISMFASKMIEASSEELPKIQILIQDRVQHMARLIEDLLDVSRAKNGKLHLEFYEVDIINILKITSAECNLFMKSKKIIFTSSLPQSPILVHGDSKRLSQIFYNLLDNAAKYTPDGGKVELSAEANNTIVKIKVCDNGIGVSSTILPKIFDPYIQDPDSKHVNGSGLGIGLTVVKELVEAHGGTVTATSPGKNKGCIFTVEISLIK